MNNSFEKILPEDINDNVFKLIGDQWMLITSGGVNSYNTMTASWGGFGVLWHKKICFCVIRPTRYTYEFVEREKNFTLSFFEKSYKNILTVCGTKSGRDIDKAKETGLTPVAGSTGSVYFSEARLVLECKKIYFQDLDNKQFLDETIEKNYPNHDYHRMYVGEIVNCNEKLIINS